MFFQRPKQIFEGTVNYEDTRQGAPNARVSIHVDEAGQGNLLLRGMDGRADENGHFRSKPFSGKAFSITALPPEGKPYLGVRQNYKKTLTSKSKEEQISDIYKDAIPLPVGKNTCQVELALVCGVLVRGRIIETSSGKPVAGASVQYDYASKIPYKRN